MPLFFQQFPEIKTLFSEKKDGSMRLSEKQEKWSTLNVENRKQYFKKVGLDNKKIIAAQLVHGKHVALVDHNSPDYILRTDGLVTTDPAVTLTVTVADCFSVYFYDGKKSIIGLAHIGWRGAVKNIVSKMIQVLKEKGSQPRDIISAIGPGICQKHYPILPARALLFDRYPEAILKKNGQIFLDIKKVIWRQLKENGIIHIADTHECTYCLSDKYFSYRRDKPEVIEAQVASITL